MKPILFYLGPWDLGDAIIAAAVIFIALLLWRWLGRLLGEEVPPLSVPAVLATCATAVALAAAAYFLLRRFGPVPIRSYGTMLVIAFMAGTALAASQARHVGLTPAVFVDLSAVVLVGAIVGARLVYVLLEWHYFRGHPADILATWHGGLSFHGGIIGGLIAGAIYSLVTKRPFCRLVDPGGLAVPFGYAIARIGCLLNGCCYGRPTSLPWGIVLPNARMLDGTPIRGPVHPTQIYASISGLLIFAILWKLRDRLFRRPCFTFLSFLGLYSIARFVIEFYRRGATAAPWKPWPAITVAQAACIATLIIVAALMAWLAKRSGGGCGGAA